MICYVSATKSTQEESYASPPRHAGLLLIRAVAPTLASAGSIKQRPSGTQLASGNLVHGVVQGVEQRTMDSGFPTMLLHLDTVSDDATPVDSLVQVEVPGGYWTDPATGQEQWLDMGFPLFTPGESILVDASVSSEGVHRPHFGPFSVFRIQGGVLHDLSQNPVVSLPSAATSLLRDTDSPRTRPRICGTESHWSPTRA